MSAPAANLPVPDDSGSAPKDGSGQASSQVAAKWHAHLCPACRRLNVCVCPSRWTVAYASCVGCAA
jgi:hypothetical protein